MANAIRFLAIDAIEKANSGHPGLPMGAADIATVLYTKFLAHDPKNPHWPDRDRFVLSAGHGAMLLYALLYLSGYEDISLEDLKNFRQIGSKLAGHPEYGHAAGIETTTGPLGQGLANAVGMALGERLQNARFGDIINHYTYALVGDGCLMEGIAQEAISFAGHLKLHKLIVLWDDNNISIDGEISLADSTDQMARFKASGWNTYKVDGHDQGAIARAIEAAQNSDKPTLIACKTTIGFGAPNKAGTNKVHGAPLGTREIAETRIALGWEAEPFVIPADILDNWRLAGLNAAKKRQKWKEKFADLPLSERIEFERLMRGDLVGGFDGAIDAYKQKLVEDCPCVATRKASEMALEVINETVIETIGGSADLTGSNNTKSSQMKSISAEDFSGRYLHYGIREHAMGAVMNGLALHGGCIPYGGTFLCFSDYMRPAMRLSSLMGLRVIYVMTHDSIGLGEDGPTHQPVEHLAALRALPNHFVFRPADAMETVECWQLALKARNTPSTLALSRQNLPLLRQEYEKENLCMLGAYELLTASDDAQVTLFSSGSELQIAVKAQALLEENAIPTRVVSVPCFELFAQQSLSYQRALVGDAPIKIAIEAAIRQGWDRFIGSDGIFIGMEGFGASGTIDALYAHFGITCENVVATVEKELEKINKENVR
ncbi:transketolase [Bartonella quintana JK 12]|nr:transketolase [Bartonella quintana BQ2-D70]ETS14723.1 transketolase [Bartonella quintana JK 73rel]ETS17156.1 transketolase [Bartonella quintana JK 73]ETS17251.1 transketolase [Bartonella quintana JK 12]ETS19449.1 transketolase [Bartonella quintana JK 7]KEC58254.1 transketolase [Bartonella quintana JK 19]KEC62159.1 transketolase [Bartonella quintana JK 31]KEC63883.1 transketolase [Bartonella quintana JK 63]KEC65022.1 transketolase [Bartonella quintana JK 68]KEC65140.1 transketolase [Bart